MLKYLLLPLFSILITNTVKSQNSIKELINDKEVYYLSLNKIDSLKILNIKLITYLSDKDKQKLMLNKKIHSSVENYFYKDNLLIKASNEYSGIDSLGNNHFKKKSTGFNAYSFVYEKYYVYDKNKKLKRIDKNIPFEENHKKLRYLGKKDRIELDNIPFYDYAKIHNFSNYYRYLIELGPEKFLYFTIQ